VIRHLQVLRAIIHNNRILNRDNAVVLEEYNKHKLILPVIALVSSGHADIYREALALLVSMLEEGNKPAQEILLQKFKSTLNEDFFADVASRLRQCLVWVKEVTWWSTLAFKSCSILLKLYLRHSFT
jgi:hypothetical protein